MIKPDHCDFCNTVINDEFVDGKSAGGPWACMCINCHSLFGIGLGTGKGQKYHKHNASDNFVKVEG